MRFLPLALLLACPTATPKEEEDTAEIDGDTGEETGEDREDTGDDTAEVTPTLYDTAAACAAEELILYGEARDDGGACVHCDAGQDIRLAGVVWNPCTFEQELYTPQYCLFSSYSYSTPDSETDIDQGCDDLEMYWTVPPGETIEQVEMLGTGTPGDWSWWFRFADVDRTVSEGSFDVR